ncbi:MAG: phosphoribosylformylglycinamidine synthase [bacterium]|nr:phosphoribosylformylglycinamidine synthase [bacterium]
MILRFFRTPALTHRKLEQVRKEAEVRVGRLLPQIHSEWCYAVELNSGLTEEEEGRLFWLLAETFEPENAGRESFLSFCRTVLEIGPQLNFETPWSSAAVAICHACGLTKVRRIERSIRYGMLEAALSDRVEELFLGELYDRMTQVPYVSPPESFTISRDPDPVRVIPLLKEGIEALRRINRELGFGWDEQDIEYITQLFTRIIGRNPTDVELIELAQANSEHSRHWFFKGRHIVDGEPCSDTLMDIVRETWRRNPNNSVIAFHDDSSAIRGNEVTMLLPTHPERPSWYRRVGRVMHPTLTAETHNHPTGLAAYEGSGTGSGGRIRDVHVVGRGGLVIAGGAGYCSDNLRIPGYDLPWEEDGWWHPPALKSPLEIMIRASDGASDYGNCFGEPLVCGFVRTSGIVLPDGRRGWYKPIMYSVGTGLIDDAHTAKGDPEPSMLVVQVGGPAYRIGLGGGAASSMLSGENAENLDLDSVQRPDPQMENRLNRFFRACVALGEDNPIVTAHDLGAGGDCNAVPEIVDPAGARIELRGIPVGDATLSSLVIWANESQERDVILIRPEKLDLITAICDRESLPMAVIGTITGDSQLVLHDEQDGSEPVNLPLREVLGEIPQKTFELETIASVRVPLALPERLTVRDALERVLRLPSVASKRFLSTKADRSVSGHIAQQQCVGPNHVTLADFAMISHSLTEETSGTAFAIGEQPMKGLLSPEAMARLAVTEALLNLSGVVISGIANVRCSANWMLAAKLPGEGVWLRRAAEAMRDFMIELGMAVDGGKDSLSMAVRTKAPDGSDATVKAPGELVISAYVDVPDVRMKVTPEFKQEGDQIFWIPLSADDYSLGGSALAQVFSQVGDECPDVSARSLQSAFSTNQELIRHGLINAVHDISDGGLIVTLLEMAFAGNLGFTVRLPRADTIAILFSESPGLVLSCNYDDWDDVQAVFVAHMIQALPIGRVRSERVVVIHDGETRLDEAMVDLRQVWEATSTAIDRLQTDPDCVNEEAEVNAHLLTPPPYLFSFDASPTPPLILSAGEKPRVAILREQGSNGDQEMAAAFEQSGFEAWDLTMTDLVSGRITLDHFRGIAFVGGFSFADVLDAGKGWAGVIRFNERVAEQFRLFQERTETFSLGVCNGCQLMALLGWVPGLSLNPDTQPRFIRNRSGRFESRFSTVEVRPSPSIMFQGMQWSRLGVWVAHGEGRLYAMGETIEQLVSDHLTPLRFVDEEGIPTERYPFNPNGSPQGVTALCSPDGRHLAMMPHPERTFLTWQWPWMPPEWRQSLTASPWLRLFQNAHTWCLK